ncbi:hypothetical protein [Actinoplanes derwentensis]|uniref:Uncharacterized protein n=1 Tax=Actinoplanes derwentensis TaxID=113562 RepID=A0A1H1Y0E6_9ACTN|nr:hypothetical protein [Actinoplanes derwentensis]GID89783.1 hypothetical protein Ade03nite_87070 [Actinoplanes derwentensis]SDT14649.1 hypothetical protein SAMN04489716_2650 [Actinoplanes derwentensis]
MLTYLMTRGHARRLDYTFLGEAPPVPWWEPVLGWVVLEEPEVIVRSTGEGLHLLVSGIPSQRRDAVNTVIRYRLVITAGPGDGDLVRRLVWAGLHDTPRRQLGLRLDEVFDAASVDGWIQHADTAGIDQVRDRLDTVLSRIDSDLPDVDAVSGPQQDWAGPAEDPQACRRFLATVDELLAGRPGMAFTTHAIASLDGARQAADAAAAVYPDPPGDTVFAVLVAEGRLGEVTRLRTPGKVPAPLERLRSPVLWIPAALLLLALLTALILTT